MSYAVVNIDDIEGSGPGGAVRFVRRELGVEAFGINWFDLPAGAEGPEHDETTSEQEEVSVVVRGSGHWRVDGTTDVPGQARHVHPLRSRDGPPGRRRTRGSDIRLDRRAPRRLRATRPVLR